MHAGQMQAEQASTLGAPSTKGSSCFKRLSASLATPNKVESSTGELKLNGYFPERGPFDLGN